MNIKGVIFDFDGVLKPLTINKNRYFWWNTDSETLKKIQTLWQNPEGLQLINQWRKGEKTSFDVCTYLANKYTLNAMDLLQTLQQSVKQWQLDTTLIDFAKTLNSKGIIPAIFTDHMDVFLEVIVPHFKLKEIFPYVFCSSEYHMLKTENNGVFMDAVASQMDIPINRLIFIDDWDKACDLASAKGAQTYLYKDQAADAKVFIDWYRDF